MGMCVCVFVKVEGRERERLNISLSLSKVVCFYTWFLRKRTESISFCWCTVYLLVMYGNVLFMISISIIPFVFLCINSFEFFFFFFFFEKKNYFEFF